MANILNRVAARKFVLIRFKELRAGPPITRVSQEYLNNLEAWIKNKIIKDIESHPSIGVTFKP